LSNAAVIGSREDSAPVLELVDVSGGFLAENLDRVLIAEIVGALDRVVGMDLGRVLRRIAERRVDAALCCAGVAAGRVQLLDHRNVRPRVEGGNGRAHACAAGAHYEDVVLSNHLSSRYPKPGLECIEDPAVGPFRIARM